MADRKVLYGPGAALPARIESGLKEAQTTSVRSLSVLAGALFLALSTVVSVYVLGIRTRSSRVGAFARVFHRALGNPRQMRTAGSAGTFASVIRHRGRKTGRTYETPVWAAPTEDGFVIRLVYGSETDWLKNVLASGDAAIVQQGQTYAVGRPAIVPAATARGYFPVAIRLVDRLIRVDRCLRVWLADATRKEEKDAAA